MGKVAYPWTDPSTKAICAYAAFIAATATLGSYRAFPIAAAFNLATTITA